MRIITIIQNHTTSRIIDHKLSFFLYDRCLKQKKQRGVKDHNFSWECGMSKGPRRWEKEQEMWYKTRGKGPGQKIKSKNYTGKVLCSPTK